MQALPDCARELVGLDVARHCQDPVGGHREAIVIGQQRFAIEARGRLLGADCLEAVRVFRVGGLRKQLEGLACEIVLAALDRRDPLYAQLLDLVRREVGVKQDVGKQVESLVE